MIKTPIETPPTPSLATDAHVVLLVNFVAPNLGPVCHEIQKRVGRLTILSSVANESNRRWELAWNDLDVVVQKNWTFTRHPRHPGGYREVNYVHIPVDTIGRLRKLRPDAIVSLELGMRTVLSMAYRKFNHSCAHIAAFNANVRSEAGRGRLRNAMRRRMIRRLDWVTHNGPSCREVLLDLGADPARLSPWHYAADPSKAYSGPISISNNRSHLSLLSVGELSERKGSELAMMQLVAWAKLNPSYSIEWNLVGSGPAEASLQQIKTPSNLNVNFHGFCDPDSIREHYQRNDAMLFPTLCDEWGLVVDESLGSGLPVIGSCHAQSVTTLIKNGHNGFVYDPERNDELASALDRIVRMTSSEYAAMPEQARQSIASRTCAASAEQFVHAVSCAMQQRRGSASPQNIEDQSVEDSMDEDSMDVGRSLVEGAAQ